MRKPLGAFTSDKKALHDVVAKTLVVDRWTFTRNPEGQQQGFSGCLIVIAALMGLGLPGMAILAAIALPAYQQYVERARIAQAPSGVSTRTDRIKPTPALERWSQRLGGECSYEVRYFGFGPELRDKYTHYDVRMADGEVVIHGRNVTLPNDKRPWACP